MSSSQEGMLRDSEIIPQKEARRPMKRSEISAYWKSKANSFIRENPGSWLRLLWRKFENFFNVYQYDDLSILKLLRDEGAVPPGLRFGFIAALGLAGLPFCWARWKTSRWVVGAVLLHVASLMPVFITERYRLAAAPGLILLGIGGLYVLCERISAADWKRASLSLGTLAAAAWFCTMPRVDAGWALDFYKAGIRATQAAILAKSRGDVANAEKAFDRGQRNLETAYAYVDQNADLVFAMGNLWMERGDVSRATACYERAVEISRDVNPARVHDGALTNLGIAASRKEDWAAAEQYFQESLKFDEADGKTWFFLAEARSKMRNRLGALEAVERARTLRPNQPEIEKLRDELRAQR
jgi:tetratricopeptide (TPR) repeat protein